MIFYTPLYDNRRIDYGRTIRTTLPVPSTGTGSACLWELIINPSGIKIRKRMHGYMEKKIKGVRYKVYSVFEGESDFRELYGKCLASRLLRIHGQGCSKIAAGD